jgi:predicted small metal-binding protein
MAKVYLISCRDAGVDCDFQARVRALDEVMQLCADHGAKQHNMKGFGPDLYRMMLGCVKTLEEGDIRADELRGLVSRSDRHPPVPSYVALSRD